MSEYADFSDYFNLLVLNASVNISLKNKYVYFEVPKAGSSTIKNTLTQYELTGLPKSYRVGPHPKPTESPFVKPYQLSDAQLRDIFADEAFFKFTFVRNPFSRTLSAFGDKLVNSNADLATRFRKKAGLPTDAAPSFAEFVEAIAKQEPKQMDKHWGVQFYQSCAAFVEMDFVGRLENFDSDFEVVQAHLKSGAKPQHHAYHATNATARVSSEYNERTAALVAEVFAKDFEAFGYDTQMELVSS